jgi:hypothetical protein
MNRQLRRIEQVLNHLEQPQATATATLEPPQPDGQRRALPAPNAAARSVSFQLTPHRAMEQATIATPIEQSSSSATASTPVPTFATTPQSDEPSGEKFKLPQFTQSPKPQSAKSLISSQSAHSASAAPNSTPSNLGFSRHHNGSNPDLALNLLQESLTLVQTWRSELQSIGQQIQAIYREGPIVDGWLECSTQQVEATTAALRNAEVSQLMGYVEAICNDPSQAQPEYRLCGLSQDGRVWSNPCPQKQLASISLAISRHQKLQPLLQRKLSLEKQLHQAAELTAVFYGKVQAL